MARTETATAMIRNYFYVNPNKVTSISAAHLTAERTETGEMKFFYTNRNMVTAPIDRATFDAKRNAGYHTDARTIDIRANWFNFEGILIRERAAVAMNPDVPVFDFA